MELKPCPFCGSPAKQGYQLLCSNDNCPNENRDEQGATFITEAQWNTRPIEDALQARIIELEAENAKLASLLRDEKEQLDIATDLGNKRWEVLNDIYINAEKHNANWCKRRAAAYFTGGNNGGL